MSEGKIQGSVKWFNDAQGFGFITCPNASGDVFVHYSQIQQEGYRRLRPDQPVNFKLQNTQKGLQAVEVEPVC